MDWWLPSRSSKGLPRGVGVVDSSGGVAVDIVVESDEDSDGMGTL